MNLLERWLLKNFEDDMILQELHFMVNAIQNPDEVFCCDENGEKIAYCILYEEGNAYGRETGVCFSEEAAFEAIKYVLNQFGFLLIPWFRQEENDQVDLCVELNMPIAYTVDSDGTQQEVFSAMFVFEKCQNKAGFCVSRVVPLLKNKEKRNYE